MSRTTSNRLCAAIGPSLAALLLLTSLAGCFTAPQTSGPEVITVIVGKAGVNLNPYTNVLSTRQIAALLFRGLLAVDDAGMPIPDLALEVPTKDNGGISADGTIITYRLDPEARWADGTPLTARDVVFTWSLISQGLLIDDPRGNPNVLDVTAPDDTTVRLTLARPDAPFAWHFVPYVLPSHLLADSPDILSDDFWVHPVGARGRMVERNVKSVQVDIVDAAGVAPTLRVVFAETDAGARKVWESTDRCIWLAPPVAATGAEQSDSVPGARWQAFVMNPSQGHPTADLAVRQAYSAVTTVTVTPDSTGPYGLPISAWVQPEASIGAALDKAGWRLASDGLRHRQGNPLTVSVLFNPVSAEEGDRIEYVIGSEFKRFGATIEPHATFPYTDYGGASRLVLGEFDVALLQFPIGIPYGWAWPFESSDVPSESNPAGLNVSRVSDAGLDQASADMRAAGSPAELQSALGAGWSRLEDLQLVLWDARLDQTVLFKGVDGVRAEPFEEYALRAAGSWRLAGAGSGE